MVELEQEEDYGDGVVWLRGKMLGKGNFGSVYLATLKKRRSKYSCFPSFMAVKSAEVSVSGSIQKEREALSNFNDCPYIVRCFGEETTRGNNNGSSTIVYNLLLEYGSGGTLANRIDNSCNKGLPEFEVKCYTKSILKGLICIHDRGYVHCDLKPDNILLMPTNGRIIEFRAKIGDFGLAKRVNLSKKRKIEPYWRGTPMYLSPETVSDGIQQQPSDIWALGCIVLAMFTGNPPWDRNRNRNQETSTEDVIKMIREKNESPKIPIELSKEGKDFLKRCFVRNTMFRFTAEMLLHHAFLEELGQYDIFDDDLQNTILVSESEEEWRVGSEDDDSCNPWSEEDDDDDDVVIENEFRSYLIAEEIEDDVINHPPMVSVGCDLAIIQPALPFSAA